MRYSGNLLVENGNGLIVGSRVWEATGTAERYAALEMLQDIPGSGRVDSGRRRGLRHGGFRARVLEHWGDAARGPKPWTQRRQRH